MTNNGNNFKNGVRNIKFQAARVNLVDRLAAYGVQVNRDQDNTGASSMAMAQDAVNSNGM